MKPRFEIRKSPVDGMLRVWEQRMASTIKTPDGCPAFEAWGFYVDPAFPTWDWAVWVCTGVYQTRREVFKDRRS